MEISIHSLRVEGDLLLITAGSQRLVISIHSLRVEGDAAIKSEECKGEDISIHSLRVEGDILVSIHSNPQMTFQSTPSVWRETVDALRQTIQRNDFNPLPPCGGRRHASP